MGFLFGVFWLSIWWKVIAAAGPMQFSRDWPFLALVVVPAALCFCIGALALMRGRD